MRFHSEGPDLSYGSLATQNGKKKVVVREKRLACYRGRAASGSEGKLFLPGGAREEAHRTKAAELPLDFPRKKGKWKQRFLTQMHFKNYWQESTHRRTRGPKVRYSGNKFLQMGGRKKGPLTVLGPPEGRECGIREKRRSKKKLLTHSGLI